MKILAFAGSNSTNSINKKLAMYAASLFPEDKVDVLDLNNYEAPIYSLEREADSGIPSLITQFAEQVSSADMIILSLAEHNSSYSVCFKNIYDWMSRIADRKVWDGKDMLLMATSPGGGGAKFVLESAQGRFPRDGATLKGVFSLPNFFETFDSQKMMIVDETKKKELDDIIQSIKS